MNAGTAASFALIMLIAGMGIPIMAAMSGGMARHIGSAPIATGIIFLIGLTSAITVAVITGLPAREKVTSIEPMYLLGGVLIAFYAISITIVGPRFGLGNAIFFVLLGQIISAVVIDHFGLMGAPVTRIDLMRIGGIALMLVGVSLARR